MKKRKCGLFEKDAGRGRKSGNDPVMTMLKDTSLLIPNYARSTQRGRELPAHPAEREGDADHRPRLPGDRRRVGAELELGAGLSRLRAGRSGAAAADGYAARVLDDMETSQVSIFAVQAQANELRTRMQMTDVVNRRKMRHAHMVNIDQQIMLEGMRADFDEVDRFSTKVWQMAPRRAKSAPPLRRAPTSRPISSAITMAQDQRHHQPRKMGQPAGRRDLYHARAK